MLGRLSLPVRPLATRRMVPVLAGSRIDGRRTLRGALRQGGEVTKLALRAPGERWPNLVVLCDISGSMSQYSRLVLHFVHAVANRKGQGWAKVHAFTFGTRLTNITRHLRARDVDVALAAAGRDLLAAQRSLVVMGASSVAEAWLAAQPARDTPQTRAHSEHKITGPIFAFAGSRSSLTLSQIGAAESLARLPVAPKDMVIDGEARRAASAPAALSSTTAPSRCSPNRPRRSIT